MTFDSIPEDREESYECPKCGGNVTLQTNGNWECDACDFGRNKMSKEDE